MKKFINYHLPAIIYAATIIILSSIPGFGHNYVFIFGYDKLIHFCVYAVFAILIFRSASHITKEVSLLMASINSLSFILFFAIGDELYQSKIPGRTSDPYDVLFDFLGAALIVTLLSLYRLQKNKRKH